MTSPAVAELWEIVHDELGENLRGVCRFEGIDAEFILRDDIQAQYSETESRSVVDNAIVNQLSTPNIVRALKAGELDATVHVLEEAWVLVYPDVLPGKSGVLVSADRSASDDGMEQAGACLELLSAETPLAAD